MIGHSYGALTALFLAVKHPELVRALVLAEPPAVSLLSHLPGEKAQTGKAMFEDIQQLNDILPINSPLLKLQSTTASILCVHTAYRWSGYTNFTTKLTTSCGAPTAGRWRCRSG